MSIEKAIAEELTLSYMHAGRSITGENVVIVAQSLARAVDFRNEQEVHAAFTKARDTEAIPLQGTLKGIVANIREKQVANRNAISWKPAITKEQSDFIYAWWHLRGTRMAWLTVEKAQSIVDAFEADPKHREFVEYQKKWKHVAADNVRRYGVVTMRTRL